MRGIRRLVAMAASIAVLAAMSGTGQALAQTSSSAPTSSTGTKTFIFGDTEQIYSLNPLKGYQLVDYIAWALAYDIPINFGIKDFAPDYAHSIVTKPPEVSSDNMTFTYTIRPNMKWSDGQPFTSSDVAWTLNYYKDKQISNWSDSVQQIDHVDAPDPTHFVIHSVAPTSVYGGGSVWLYAYILPEHIWSKFKDPQGEKGYPAVGSGPYVIKSNTQNNTFTLERNPYYWGNDVPGMRPTYDRIIYQNFNEESQEAAALTKGEIDFGYFDSPNALNRLKTTPNVATHGAVTPYFHEIGFNTGSNSSADTSGGFQPHGDPIHAVTDPAFRRVVREAVDDQTIVDKVLLGYGAVADSPFSDAATTGPWSPPAGTELPFNLTKAKADLTAAGYVDTDGNGIVNDPVTKKDVVLRYFVRSDDSNSVKTADYVQPWLQQIGIGVKVSAMNGTNALWPAIVAGNYDMFEWDWIPNPDPNSILSVMTCSERNPNTNINDARSSDSYFCNPEYDKLFNDQQHATSTAQRDDMVHQMQDILWQDMPYVVLYYAQTLEAYRTDRVAGFQAQPEKIGDLLATFGPLSFISLHPPTTTVATTSSSSSSGVIWIVVVLAIALIIGVVVFVRRRRTEEDEA